ncbi:MAG: ATP-dependent DNA helicase RecG [Deltaproteobacteria bacterium]|nr:ATP-dependent DNA helicase RecG [Deltaproteobacteria bacterium]
MELTRLQGVGPAMAKRLADAGFRRVEDLITIIPRGYIDRTRITPIAQLQDGALAHVIGMASSATTSRGWGGRGAFGKVTIADETGEIRAYFFGATAKGLRSSFRDGRRMLLSGIVRTHRDELAFSHPDVVFLDDPETSYAKYLPKYPEFEGVSAKRLAAWILQAIDLVEDRLIDALPRDELGLDLPSLADALRAIHRPPDETDPTALASRNTTAYRRLIFDELFFLQLGLMLRRKNSEIERTARLPTKSSLADAILHDVGFTMTTAQAAALATVHADLSADRPMHRLLMGDVGCGKTIVAILAAARVIESGYQAALMAPTEVLARQQYERWSPIFERLGVGVGLFLGEGSEVVRESTRRLARGAIGLAFGTHALLGARAKFDRLAFVVVDEQHRFGVGQRARLSDKALTPHVLVMSATPIPRSLAHTAFGDLDLCVIRERPPGRRGGETVWVEDDRDRAFGLLAPTLARGDRVFVVFPAVEGSEESDIANAVGFFRKEAELRFSGIPIGLLHGRMTGVEKERALRDFAEGRTRVLVATTVIEVGVDVAEAGAVLIEDAQRFGLSSLHQIRGRVGRSDRPGLCVLCSRGPLTETAKRRLQTLVDCDDGFRIADEDLAIRGPGDMLGARQSGLPKLRFASLARDLETLEQARNAARTWWGKRSDLRADPAVERILRHRFGNRLEFGTIG